MVSSTLISDNYSRESPSAGRRPEASWWDDGSLYELGTVLFASLPRSDQRKKGIDYLRGLLEVDGRRSIRNIAALLGGPATEQSLHHFVCSSTWDWGPVRQALAQHLARNAPPLAWVVRSMITPKAGENSVGVDRQYMPEMDRVLNAQRAVGVWAASEHASTPVNWRIYLSPSWLDNPVRRRQAAIPDELDGRTLGEMTVDACLETATEWGLPPRPVVLDARSMDVSTMVQRFGAAGAPFLARVNPSFPFSLAEPVRPGRSPVVQSAGHLVISERDGLRATLWREHTANTSVLRTSLASALRVRLPHDSRQSVGKELALLGVGENRRNWPGELWLTDMTETPLPALVAWSKLTARTDQDFATTDQLGIRDFTGRSYCGWHRHVTLASAAHAVSSMRDPAKHAGR